VYQYADRLAFLNLAGIVDAALNLGFVHFDFFPVIVELQKKILGPLIAPARKTGGPDHIPYTNIKLMLGPEQRRGIGEAAFDGKPSEQFYLPKTKPGVFSLGEKLNPGVAFVFT
jgi:hypothetical protein